MTRAVIKSIPYPVFFLSIAFIIFSSRITSAENQKKITINPKLTAYLNKQTKIPTKIIIPKKEILTNPRLIMSRNNIKPLSFIDIQFPVHYSDSSINKKINYFYINTLTPVTLYNIIFNKESLISWCLFQKNIYLNNITFNKKINFSNNTINGKTVINNIKANDKSKLNLNLFKKNIKIKNSIFLKSISLSGNTFIKGLELLHCEFDKTANLSRSTLNSKTVFESTSFFKGLNLSNTTFNGNIQFHHVIIHGTLNLSNITIKGNDKLDLRDFEPEFFGKKIPTILTGTNISKIEINYKNIRIIFKPDTAPLTITHTYKNILEYLKKSNQLESYKDIMIEYQDYKNKYNNKTITNTISKHFWNYGFNKHQGLNWILLTYLIFTSINTAMYPRIIQRYSNIKFLEKCNIDTISKLNPLIRFIYYFPFASFLTLYLMTGGTMRISYLSISTPKGRNFLLHYYIFIVCVFGFFSMLYLLSLIL